MTARIFLIFLLISACCMAMVVPCQCGEDTIYEIQGKIVSMDWVEGVIVVKWLQSSPNITYDEMTIQVPKDIRIMKGTDIIGFVDVNQFDQVTVKYKRQQIGLPKAIGMTIDDPV